MTSEGSQRSILGIIMLNKYMPEVVYSYTCLFADGAKVMRRLGKVEKSQSFQED